MAGWRERTDCISLSLCHVASALGGGSEKTVKAFQRTLLADDSTPGTTPQHVSIGELIKTQMKAFDNKNNNNKTLFI